jgi:hypothetical protein
MLKSATESTAFQSEVFWHRTLMILRAALSPAYEAKSAAELWQDFVAGDQRSSYAGTVDHSFDLQVGGGQVKLSDRFALQFVPAEYDLATPSSGATPSYAANTGMSWTFWKQRK